MKEIDQSAYSIVAMMPVNTEGPGFCTPLFRSETGERFFLQSLQMRRKIAFVYVGPSIPESACVSFMHNGVAVVGGEPLLGFRLKNGKILMDTKRKIHRYAVENLYDYEDYPFLFFQLARLSRKADPIKKAVINENVSNAISKGWITLRKSEPYFIWTSANVSKLLELAAINKSTLEIARELGTSRNAVLSKLKRLNKAMNKMESEDLFSAAEMPITRVTYATSAPLLALRGNSVATSVLKQSPKKK